MNSRRFMVNLALIQRDDGQIRNQTVGLDQLKAEVPVGFNAPVVWTTATAYTAGSSTVFNGSGFYRCLVTHTSGVFATDLAALKWQLIVNMAAIPLVAANQIAVTPSGNLTTNVQTSLQAVDAAKAAVSHTHLAAAISDSTAAGRAMLTAANLAAQQTLLGLGALAFLNTVPVTQITANVAFTNPISPAALTGNTNDWTPTGWATAAVVKLSASAAFSITGFAATNDGDIKILQNTGAFAVTIPFESASSAAANRVTGPNLPFATTVPASFTLPPGNTVTLIYDGTAARWRAPSQVNTQAIIPGYITGLTLSTAGASATISIAAGSATDSANTTLMTLASAISKTTSAWAVGSGNGGLDTGAIANSTSYHFYEIQRLDTGVVDVIFSLSASAPAYPTGYTISRRIGSMKTNGSAQWTSFTQTNDDFILSAPVTDVNAIATTTARVNKALSVPTGIPLRALFRAGVNASAAAFGMIFTSLQENDQAPSGGGVADLCTSNSYAAGSFERWTDTSAQIGVRSNSTAANYTISTYGWKDLRGK
jgi:hypothetical protein